MDDLYEWNQRHPWFSPSAWSVGLHLLLVIFLAFIVIPGENPNEHVTEHFRVKGVKDIPIIAGKPGGGTAQRFMDPSLLVAQSGTARNLQDVSLQTLVDPSDPLKQISVEVEPKKTE